MIVVDRVQFLLACHSLTLDMNQGPQTTHMAGIREASLAAFTLIHQLCADDPNATLVAGTCRLFLAFSIVLVSLSIRRKPHLFTRDGRLVDAETTSSILSRCSMAWSRNAILIAGQTSGLEGTPALDHKTRSRSQPPLDLSSSTLLAQIVSQRTPVIAKQWTLTILRTILTFGSPFCVLRLITSFESGHGENKWAWLSGIALFSTCETVVHYHQNWIQWSELGIPIRAQLITSIYAKLLESSLGNITTSLLDQPGHRRSPPVSSLLTSDATTISKFAAIHYILPLSLVQFLMALAFIQKLMGWQGMLITLLVTVLTMPLNDLIVRRRKSTQTELRKTRDQKDRAVNEMIKALHHIKVQGAEEMWKLRIQEYRDQELCAEKRDLQSQIYGSMWKIASPLLVSGISIFANAYLSGEMSASVIFTILELLPQLQGTLGLAPLVVQDYLSAKASARRVESYLSQPDKDNYLQPSRSGDIVFENARFSWPGTSSNRESTPQMTSSGFELSDVNIRVPDRKLTILYGNTGGGKSLMLTAMLGEACLLDGTIEAPCPAQGSQVAYVAQTPWLQSSTIKENILFGRPADPERYSSVLEACDLIQDLDALSNGDETVIGAQGVKVSGGQRARISLARALYSDAKVLIMDDVLSALDTHVAKHVFKALLGPLGAGRTRVLATHQLGLCMPGADYAICVTNGTVQVDVPGSIDTYRALALPSDAAEEKAVMNCDLLAARPDRSKNLHKNHQEKGCSKPKLNYGSMKKELSQTTYSIYVKAIGGRTFAISFLLTLLSRQFLITLPMWKLKNLRLDMQDPVVHESAIASVWYHAGMFVVSSALAVMAEYTFGQVEASGTLRASETLFSTMLDTVVHMPLAWLHDASTGDLLQRFSADSQAMDDRLMPLVSEFSQCFIEMVTIVIVGWGQSFR